MSREKLLIAAFLACPFMILSTGYIWTGQQIGLLVMFTALLAASVTNGWVRAFMLFAVAWSAWLFFAGFSSVQLRRVAILAHTQILFMCAGAFIFTLASESKGRLGAFYNAICAAALLQAIAAGLQGAGLFDFVNWYTSLLAPAGSLQEIKNPMVGMLGNQNYVGAFLAVSLPFFFRRYWILTAPVLVYDLALLDSSSATIAAIIGCAAFCVARYGSGIGIGSLGRGAKASLVAVPLLAAALIAGNVFILDPFWQNDRFDMWRSAMQQVMATPWGGLFGLGPSAAWARNHSLHSEWVTLFHQFGMVGVILAIGYVFTVPRRNPILLASLAVAVVNMGGNAALHIPATAFLVCMVAGLLERERRENGRMGLLPR